MVPLRVSATGRNASLAVQDAAVVVRLMAVRRAVNLPTVRLTAPAGVGGQAIYIQHDNGDVTVYGHIETIYVDAGQQVVAGQEIAGVGSRGFSTGPHLHFEVQQGGIGGTRVDPLDWLAARGVYL